MVCDGWMDGPLFVCGQIQNKNCFAAAAVTIGILLQTTTDDNDNDDYDYKEDPS
jgi:hypothetical protein